MKHRSGKWMLATVAVVSGCAVLSALADRPNPYQTIIDRNVFSLKPPPPPPDPSLQNTPPPVPLATVKLTGITSLFSKKKALLEITPAPGKPPVKPILQEGDRAEGVEVVTIDMDKNQVALKIGSVLTNITFEVVKSPPTPTGPPVPTVPVPGRPIVPVPTPPTPEDQSAAVTAPAASGSGRGSIVLTGGAALEPAAAPTGTPVQAATPGFRAIPSRQIRTPQAQPQTAMDSYINLEAMRHERLQNQAQGLPARIPPLPPTPLTDAIYGAPEQPANQQGPPSPWTGPGPPPLPTRR